MQRIAFKRADYTIALISFFISYFIYLLTLPSSVWFGDSGDFITSAYVLGIPHPSGYPLYTILGHLFSYIPISNIGMRITLMSSIFGSLTSMLLYLLLIKLSVQRLISFSTALCFAFSYTFFRVSIYAKTYSLYGFFVILLLFILLLYQENIKKNFKYLVLFSFILGVSFTNHNLMATIIPGVILFLFIINKPIFRINRISYLFLFFLLGLSVFLYLPIRAFQNPPIDWANPTTLKRFIDCLTVKFAQKRMLNITLLKFFITFGNHIILILKQFLIFCVILIFGFYPLKRKNYSFFILILTIILVNTLFSLIIYPIEKGLVDFEAYHIPSFLSLAILLGIGLNFIIEKKKALKFTIIFIPLTICFKYYYVSDKSKFYFAYDYARNILRDLPKNTILFTYTDHEFMTLWYLKHIEKRREDIVQLNLYDLTTDWVIKRVLKEHKDIRFTGDFNAHYLFKLENLAKNNIDRFNIFYTFNEDIYNPGYKVAYSSSLSNYGILFKIEKDGIPKIYDVSYLIRDAGVYRDTFTKGVLKIYGYGYAMMGSKYVYREPKKAIFLFESAIKFDPENEMYKKGLEIANQNSKL
ncbi:MAG: DUF2723 domain-containing protein [bacterium]